MTAAVGLGVAARTVVLVVATVFAATEVLELGAAAEAVVAGACGAAAVDGATVGAAADVVGATAVGGGVRGRTSRARRRSGSRS